MSSDSENKKPGIIDPPMNVQDSFTLQTWMQQVTETLRQSVGQVGSLGQSFVRFDDLVQGGLLRETGIGQSYSHAYSDGSVAGGAYQGSGTGSETYDLTPPGVVTGVVLASFVGAIQIEWVPPSVSFPHYFQVWRSSTGNAADRVMVGTTSALRYTDVNVADGVTYTYWVRVVKSVGSSVIYGAYDSDSGTAAIPKSTATNILDIVGKDMYIKTPGGDINPFTYLNLGTDDIPAWVVALRADVAIQGSLAINQLESGELSPGAAFSLGNQSVVMDTRSDGSGQVVVSGDGGTQNNDYLVLNQGAIASYVWNGSEHVPYKEVRRIERGVASAGQQVTIPAWFKAQPTIYLAPFIIPTYNPDYPNQGQQWRLSHSNVEPNPNQAGGWIFTPVAQLELTDGNSTQVYPDRTYSGSSDTYETVISNRTSLKGCQVNARINSVRSTGAAGNYYNRQVTVQVWYRSTGTTTWKVGPAKTVNPNQSNDATVVVDFTTPSVGNYDLKVTYTAADVGGTYNTGTQYEYTTRTVSGVGVHLADGDVLSSTISSTTLYNPAPSLSGWSVVKSRWSYSYVLAWQGKNWRFSLERPGTSTYNANYYTNPPLTGNIYSEASYLDERCYVSVYSGGGSYKWINVDINNVQVVYTYRRPIPVTSTPANNFYLDTIEYDQGAQQINPTNETILLNWLAVGE